MNTLKSVDKESLIYIDETSIDQEWFREYADAKRGKRYQRTSIVATQHGKNILAPLRYPSTMDYSIFEKWLKNQSLSVVSENSCLILDNASFHRKKSLQI